MLLHVDRAAAWASVAALASSPGGSPARARRLVPRPGVGARAAGAGALVAVVLARFHTLNGLAAGTTLLLLMAALKLLETRSARDQLVVLGAALFLLLAACLDRAEPACARRCTRSRRGCAARRSRVTATPGIARAARRCRLAGRALLLALPLALLLFLFFPRLAGRLLGDAARRGGGHRARPTRMSPGSIPQLTANYDPAFRVQFDRARAAARGALLARPGAARLRRPHLAQRAAAVPTHAQPLEFLGTPYRYRVDARADASSAGGSRSTRRSQSPDADACCSPTTTS